MYQKNILFIHSLCHLNPVKPVLSQNYIEIKIEISMAEYSQKNITKHETF